MYRAEGVQDKVTSCWLNLNVIDPAAVAIVHIALDAAWYWSCFVRARLPQAIKPDADTREQGLGESAAPALCLSTSILHVCLR
jgi:hypothetical protein